MQRVWKLLQPADKLAQMWPWVWRVPGAIVTLTGVVDMPGAQGLPLPALQRHGYTLMGIAAVCITILMACVAVFHILRGEGGLIMPHMTFALMAAFIAWGWLRSRQSV